MSDPKKTVPLRPNEFNDFEFLAERFEVIPSRGHTNRYDTCDASKLDLVLSCAMGTSEVEPSWHREEIESSLEELHDADWSDLTESQLEELVLSNLDTIFKNATKKIIASGYIEEVAIEAILRPGLCHVRNDLEKECQNSISNASDETFGAAGISHTTIAKEKFVGSRKVNGITKREYILHQKSISFEHYRNRGSIVASRAEKLSGFGV
ncbi:Hypothetical predicted protein [Olea europaea subsp. europaea]|uniref:Uncharacterized protein n=1 Tax=Olea europaea subsp. europaea TaxID=158383 RepID=A0A8S0SFB5_OLEEU|nr:Hypothetical predicted protein [Olea europaea subsp. europaea]